MKKESLVVKYLEARKNVELAKRLLDSNKEVLDTLQDELIVHLEKNSDNTISFHESVIKLVKRAYVKVFDEEAVMKALRESKITGLTKPKLDVTKFKKYANKLYEEDSLLLEGSDWVETKSITVVGIENHSKMVSKLK